MAQDERLNKSMVEQDMLVKQRQRSIVELAKNDYILYRQKYQSQLAMREQSRKAIQTESRNIEQGLNNLNLNLQFRTSMAKKNLENIVQSMRNESQKVSRTYNQYTNLMLDRDSN